MARKQRDKPTPPKLVIIDANNRLARLACSIKAQHRKAVDNALINHYVELAAKRSKT